MTFPLLSEKRIHERAAQQSEDDAYRKEIQDLFRDYRHPWDILTELIQNAVDAINLNVNIQRGRIDIRISSRDRTLTVRDNGTGIRSEHVKAVLVPSVSIEKRSAATYGYKGVGLSFVAHLTTSFSITSTRGGNRKSYTLKNCLDWVIGKETPVEEIDEPVTTVEDSPSETEVCVTLAANYGETSLRTLQSMNGFFEWAKDKRLLEYVLRTRTAIGNTSVYLGTQPIKPIDVLVAIDDKPEFAISYKLLTPFDASYCAKSRYMLHESHADNPPYADKYVNAKLKDTDKQFRALRCDISGLEVGTWVKTQFDLSILVCGETGVSELENEYGLDNLNDTHKGSFEMGTGIYLCINGMPTGILLHRWNDGFNKRFLCYVNVGMEANAELDKGRKGISEHTRKLIVDEVSNQLSKKRVSDKYTLRHLAQRMKDTLSRGYAGTDVKTHLEKWDKQDTVIDFGAITKPPLDENAVVFIFAQLIGAGLLNGYEVRYISQDATFDFCFSYRVDESKLDESAVSVSRGFIDSLDYALEDRDGLLLGRRGEDYHVGEFKISAEDIVASEKQPVGDLDLLVVWDMDEDEVEKLGGAIREVNVDKRKYDGVTHLLGDSGSDCQVICLKTVLEKLNLSSEHKI